MEYRRTIRFADTDAAGVVYFANLLSVCHEAYEASIAASGIDLRSFFSASSTAVPILHADIEFFRPVFCGDTIVVKLTSQRLSESEFSVTYNIVKSGEDRSIARATTRHACIDAQKRRRQPLPEDLDRWVLANSP
ncbi:MAG: acyl-CoA thioesterase [Cyanobacteria bacterium SID2]|nr:acyl-CoA thioesterase [Cyanobacteria bacterium SID2]